MFYSRTLNSKINRLRERLLRIVYNLNNKVNKLHERCLCIIHNDSTCSFTVLLEIDNLVSVHHRNIQVLATELYKFVNGLSPKLTVLN